MLAVGRVMKGEDAPPAFVEFGVLLTTIEFVLLLLISCNAPDQL